MDQSRPEEETGNRDASPARRMAALIRNYQEELCQRWLEEVRKHIDAAQAHSDLELADHLLDLLDDIIHTLENLGEELDPARADSFGFIAVSSSQHGRERATLEGFSVGNLVQEYILLRHLITGYCTRHFPSDTHAIDIVNRVIEAASLNAVNEFVRAMQEIRHKLMATLIHDVRTPLGVAHNYVELLSVAQIPLAERHQAVTTVTRNLRRAIAMLEQLLDATRLRAGGGLLLHFEETDLDAALRTTCIEANLVYGTEILAELENRPVLGVFDTAMIVRTVENLLANAVKFGRRGRPIRLSLRDLGEQVEILVHNEGEPIAKSKQQDIFHFFSSHPSAQSASHKAWGLGLALIRTVAGSHGGEVILRSSAEQGTTIGMLLRKRFRRPGEEQTALL